MSKFKLSDLTLREKIGQTVVIEGSLLMNMDLEGKLEEYAKDNPVGVWHTCNVAMAMANLANISNGKLEDSTFYRKWAEKYSSLMRVKPFIGLDFPSSAYATDIPGLASIPVVGANDNAETAKKYGDYIAKLARATGANWIWKPNVDIPSRFCSVNIARQVSSNPDKLVELAGAMISGGQAGGIAMTAKHFPGADKKEYRDSHFVCTNVNSTIEEWEAGQGKVFRNLVENGVLSVMVGHQGFPAVDSRKFGNMYAPSTISYDVITGLLKEKLGFEGVVVTDGIDMNALKSIYPTDEELYVALLNAGNDVLLGAKRLDYVDIIEKAVAEGKVSEERINDACRRILYVKEKIGLFDAREEITVTNELVEELKSFNTQIAEKALVLQCDLNNMLPLDKSKIKNVAILSFGHAEGVLAELVNMKEEFERRGIKTRLQRRIESYEQMHEISEENDLIIYASYVAPHAPMGGSGLFCEECSALFFALSEGKEKSIGLSMGSPYVYYDYFMNMDAYVHAFSPCRESQIAFVKAIFGEIPFEGVYQFEKPWEE